MGANLDISLIGMLTNFGGLGIVLLLICTGWLAPKWVIDRLEKEVDTLKAAMEIERTRNAELAGTTGTTARLVTALTEIAMERNHQPRQGEWTPHPLEPGAEQWAPPQEPGGSP